MKHDPVKVAQALNRTAALLDEHGARTERTIADWAAGGSSGGSGPGQLNAVSDPTGNAAVGEPDPLAGLWRRWLAARSNLCEAVWARDPAPSSWPLPPLCGRLAAACGALTQSELARAWAITGEFDAIIYMALPLDREAAEEQLREEAYMALPKDCSVCESPTPELRSGMCDGCRKRKTVYLERHFGEFDHNAYKAWIVADITAGLISRPASPYSPVAKRMAPEAEVEGRTA